MGQLVGKVKRYFGKIGVAVIDVVSGEIRIGDVIRIKNSEDQFDQTVDSMQVDHEEVQVASAGQSVGLKVNASVNEGDEVYKM